MDSPISSKISLLRQLAKYVPTCVQKPILSGIYSSFDRLWLHHIGYNINCKHPTVVKTAETAALIIIKDNFDTSPSLMFQALNWLSTENRLKYNKAVITYRALNNLTPDYLTELLTLLSEIQSLNLRSSAYGLLHIPLSRMRRFDNSFTCSVPKLWNALPQIFRASGSLLTFKTNLKHCFYS